MSTSKMANIKIDKEIIEDLQKNKYKPCFVKKIGDSDHVVWTFHDNRLNNKTLSWSSDYSTCSRDTFQESMQGETSCNPMTISLGQDDEDGTLSKTVDGDGANCLTAKKEYEKTHQE